MTGDDDSRPPRRGRPADATGPDSPGPGRDQSSEESTEVTFGSMDTPGPKVVATVALEM